MSQKQLNFFEPIETQTKPANGNSNLVDYGIQNDASDYRAHVGYVTQHIFVFPTSEGKRAVERCADPVKIGGQKGYTNPTFTGKAVPISSIDRLQAVLIPHLIYNNNKIYREMETTTKGLLAVKIVFEMLAGGLVSLPLDVNIESDKDLQISGTDIIVSSKLKIQVKCDYLAGERKYGGTGNIFLQLSECNPRKLY